jgi:L-alanine-DL-glutamate epimerase-like enolase superfamily enzyme
MKIVSLECQPVRMNLSEPYTIAYETITGCTNVFIKAVTDNGIRGAGCAAPDLAVTGETGETVLDDYRRFIEPNLKGSNPFHYVRIIEQLKGLMPHSPSALAMVDILLYDIIARQAGVPLYHYLGGYRDHIATSITIGIMPLAQTLERAAQHIRNGFRILKIKGGVNVEEDIEKIIRVREQGGRHIEIRFDANQGYSVEEAIRFVERTRHARIEILEQPSPKDKTDQMGRISRNIPIPVMADESLMNLKDVFRLTRNDLIDMINIKLMKVGGISEAMHINSVARAAGVEAMVGCMDESALAIAAGLHFALARPNIQYADLDGYLDLVNDPAHDAVILRNGILYPQQRPGLGAEVME